MLYVFQVDTGTMLTFDMKVALESVANLQTVIASACHIPDEKQVLLISGGDNLDPRLRVCSYSAGTDTNPIFLFSKVCIESANPPIPSVDHDPGNVDMKDQVEATLNLPPTYNAVVSRSQMAQQLHDLAKDQMRVCERLVHDQHLQQQGWAAVVANLEDIISAFRTRTELFQEKFQSYLEIRESHLTILQNFNHDLSLLGQIPVLPSLLYNSSEHQEVMTLLQWISIKDNQSSLEQVAEQGQEGLKQFDESLFLELKDEMQTALETANHANMKEVKGLEERLYGLEQLIHQAQKLVQGQSELAQAFLQNQQRASNLGDASILPDLCASHKNQLKMMLTNHKQLTDIRQRIFAAKEELSSNLHARLRWIMYVEMTMCEVDNKLIIYHEQIKRLKRVLEIINQIHIAPKLYIAAVVEVVRRKKFSSEFLKWATELSSKSQELHEKEIILREEFSCAISHHFLNSLFPGLHDFPPPFATETPSLFDGKLPNIEMKDVEHLRQVLPNMADDLRVPDVNVISSLAPTCDMDSLEQKRKISCGNHLQSSSVSPSQDSQLTLTNQSALHVCPDRSRSSSRDEITPPLPEKISEADDEFHSFEPTGELKSIIGLETFTKIEKAKEEGACSMTSPTGLKNRLGSCSDTKEHESEIGEDGQHIADRNLTPDSVTTTSQDFLTADFYIDESMPSSYTESNGTLGHKSEGTMKKSHHVIVAELQQKLEEKSNLIISLQQELNQYKGTLEKSEEKLKLLKELEEKTRFDLKDDISNVGKQLENDRREFSEFIDTLSRCLHNVILSVEQRIDDEHRIAIQNAIENTREEHNKLLLKNQDILELEINKLQDAQREIEMYEDQIHCKDTALENVKQEYEKKISEIQENCNTDKAELLKNLTIEHELDLDKLKMEFISDIETKEIDIKKLQDTISEKLDLVDSLMKEKATFELHLNEKFQEEKNQLLKIVLEDHQEKHLVELNKLKETLTKNYQEEIELLKLSHEEQLKKERDELTHINLEKVQEVEELHNKLEEIEQRFLQEKELHVKELHVLDLQQTNKLDNLKCRFRVAYMSFIDETSSPILDPLLEVEQVLSRLKEKFDLEKIKAIEEAEIEAQKKFNEEKIQVVQQILHEEQERYKHELSNAIITAVEEERLRYAEDKTNALSEAVKFERAQHQEEIHKLTEDFQRQNLEALISLKANVQAEKQITFNEAVNRVCSEKDIIIGELRFKELSLQQQLNKEKETLDKLLQEKLDLADEKDKRLLEALENEKIMRGTLNKLETELIEASKKITELQTANEMNVSVATISETSISGGTNSKFKEKIQELETTLKSKEDELARLQQCMHDMAVSSSTVALIQSDKVSIVSCNVGDIVLFFFEEKYENYVAFMVKSGLHFLHSDCIPILGLSPAESGQNRKPWVIAEVTDKEYCQAKKSQNRFHVSIGTKFYRVKAKPWDKETALRKDQNRRGIP